MIILSMEQYPQVLIYRWEGLRCPVWDNILTGNYIFTIDVSKYSN